MSEFGFGVRAESTVCPEMKILIQHYKDQDPVEFIVKSNLGAPVIRFPDGTAMFIKKNGEKYEYELIVSRNAIARLRKQYEE